MNYIRSFKQWVDLTYQKYNQNLTATVMTAASISAADQLLIVAFIGDLNRLKQLMSGTIPGTAFDAMFDTTAYLGLV